MNCVSVKQINTYIKGIISGNINAEIFQVYFDSRNIVSAENALFIALKNNEFIEDAYKKGIRNFICSTLKNPKSDCNYIFIENPLDALRVWAKNHRSQFHFPIIGITGSNGKTIVKEWLYHLLWQNFTIVRSPKSYNSQLGLALSLLEINDKHTLGIFEVGISEPKEMENQETILEPEIGILTNINVAHLQNFSSKEDLILEKLKLFKKSKIIIAPYDEEILNHLKNNAKIFTFGKNKNADYQLIKFESNNNYTLLTIQHFGNTSVIEIPFTDEASIENALCVFATINSLNVDVENSYKKFSTLQAVEMRLELKQGKNNCTLINDTYNSDITSIEIALNVLNQQDKKKILIITDFQHILLNDVSFFSEVSSLVNSYRFDAVFLIGKHLPKYFELFKNHKKSFSNTVDCIAYFEENQPKNSAILLKGSRDFHLESVSQFLSYQIHETILEVNLHNLLANVDYFKSKLKSSTKLMAMVKANAYGMGMIEIAQVLQHYKVDYLGVAYADEGELLRKKGIYLPIMVMNPEQNSYDKIIENQLEPEIYSTNTLVLFLQKLKQKSVTEIYPIHLKIDSGMHRLGFSFEDLDAVIYLIKEHQNIEIKSIFSHLATADDLQEKNFALSQINYFETCYNNITASLEYLPMKHILNSSGIINFVDYQFDMVRLGIGMYGYISDNEALKYLENVATLKTIISQKRKISIGESVSYGRKFVAEKNMTIATLPIGYADGIPRFITKNNPFVIINKQKAAVIGTICMDMMMCDVTEIDCNEGDEVIVFGDFPSISDFANWCETIPYECYTSISQRVKRIYYRE